jgi:ABC-2 type transport system permease protein
MFTRSLGAEALKFVRRGALWLVFALWLFLSLLFTYVLPDRSGHGHVPAALLPAHLATTAITGYSFFGGSLVFILGVLWIGSEFGWNTWKTLFTLGPSRALTLLAQLAVLALATALLVMLSYAASAVASAILAASAGLPVAWPGAGALAGSMAAAWLILCMWGFAGAALAMLTRGTALAIGLGLVWALLVENLLRSFAGALPLIATLDRLLPGTNGEAAIAAVGGTTAAAAVGAVRAFVTVGVYAALSALVVLAVGMRRDVG